MSTARPQLHTRRRQNLSLRRPRQRVRRSEAQHSQVSERFIYLEHTQRSVQLGDSHHVRRVSAASRVTHGSGLARQVRRSSLSGGLWRHERLSIGRLVGARHRDIVMEPTEDVWCCSFAEKSSQRNPHRRQDVHLWWLGAAHRRQLYMRKGMAVHEHTRRVGLEDDGVGTVCD